MQIKIFNSLRGRKAKALTTLSFGNHLSLRFRAEAKTEPVEILIYDEIGRDFWTGEGLTAADFKKALDAVPAGRDVLIRVNSPGGDVHQGLAIYNLIDQFPGRVDAVIDGIAASAASWIPLACDSVSMPRTAQMFIHDAISCCCGNAEDMNATADLLDTMSDQIAGIYSAKNGKPVAEMRNCMRDEMLMTGQQAYDLGLVDTLTETAPARNFTPEELRQMRNRLKTVAAPRQSAANSVPKNAHANQPPLMNRAQLIKMLNRFGIKFADTATDAELLALLENFNPTASGNPTNVAGTGTAGTGAAAATANAGTGTAPTPSPEFAALQRQVTELQSQNSEARRTRLTNEVQILVDTDRIPLSIRDSVINRAMADETVLNDYRSLPSRPPGANPVAGVVELTSESFLDIQNHIVTNGPAFTRKFIGANAHRAFDQHAASDLQSRALNVARVIAKNRAKILEAWNTNTIDAELQRTVILSDFARAFAKRLLALKVFCTTFSNVPLQGTDKVAVPYFPLQTAASTDWVPATGYVTGDTSEQMREITINKRKYQGMAFTSSELRRQPYQFWEKLLLMNAEKLGVDVNQDVLSIITAANYGASVKAVPAAAFSGDDIADLYVAATDLHWPDEGRNLTLRSDYKGALLKDPTFKSALAYGSTDPIRKAMIQDAYDFENINTVPASTLPANGEHLTGFMNHSSAAGVATAPIMPAEAVRALMVRYDVVPDLVNNIAVEYRLMGDAFKDKQSEIVECNYGYAAWVQTALARITDQ